MTGVFGADDVAALPRPMFRKLRFLMIADSISRLSALTGLSRTTITKAVEELRRGEKLVSPGEGRVRRVGGGRKKVEGVDPG